MPSLCFAILPDSNENLPLDIDSINVGFDEVLLNFSTENSESPFKVKSELSVKEIIIEEPLSSVILSLIKIR